MEITMNFRQDDINPLQQALADSNLVERLRHDATYVDYETGAYFAPSDILKLLGIIDRLAADKVKLLAEVMRLEGENKAAVELVAQLEDDWEPFEELAK
jgi:hypothetical protein